MTRKELKTLLYENPNAFWQYVADEGLNETIVSVLDETDAERDGSGTEVGSLMACQGVLSLIHI